MDKKLKIGWFSFTCCEDSTIIFTELLNTNFNQWLSKIDFVHARIFKKDPDNKIRKMDIAFIEGAISSVSQEKRLKKIRNQAKVLVAIGSCAVLGSPSNQRNFFNSYQMKEILPILKKFKYKKKVQKPSDLVKIDFNIPGCPMDEKKFVDFLNRQLNKI